MLKKIRLQTDEKIIKHFKEERDFALIPIMILINLKVHMLSYSPENDRLQKKRILAFNYRNSFEFSYIAQLVYENPRNSKKAKIPNIFSV